MPIYNSQKYLEKSILSIINQTGEFELILVDDGSSDGSLAICEAYEKKDSRIKVIHTGNHGVAHARNVGIETAKGEYIEFIDSDDLLVDGSIATIVSAIEKQAPDVIVFSFQAFGNSDVKSKTSDFYVSEQHALGEQICELLRTGKIVSCWNKVYKKKIIRQVRFREDLSYAEDYLFNLELFPSVRSICGLEDILYLYRMEGTVSLSKGFCENNFIVAKLLMEKSMHLLDAFGMSGYDDVKKNYAYNMTAIIHRLVKQKNISVCEKIKILKRHCSEEYIESMNLFYPGCFAKLLTMRNFFVLYLYTRLVKMKE